LGPSAGAKVGALRLDSGPKPPRGTRPFGGAPLRKPLVAHSFGVILRPRAPTACSSKGRGGAGSGAGLSSLALENFFFGRGPGGLGAVQGRARGLPAFSWRSFFFQLQKAQKPPFAARVFYEGAQKKGLLAGDASRLRPSSWIPKKPKKLAWLNSGEGSGFNRAGTGGPSSEVGCSIVRGPLNPPVKISKAGKRAPRSFLSCRRGVIQAPAFPGRGTAQTK